jgi:hypothetical protein
MDPKEIIAMDSIKTQKIQNFSDMEDLVFNSKSKELFYHSCIDGELTLVRTVKDIEDLKMAIYDGFPYHRGQYNLD